MEFLREKNQRRVSPNSLTRPGLISEVHIGHSPSTQQRLFRTESLFTSQTNKEQIQKSKAKALKDEVIKKVNEIANNYNYDNSVSQVDYFDVNYYCFVDGNKIEVLEG